MRIRHLENEGEIKEGDLLIISATFCDNPFSCTARKVLNSDGSEEVVYNRAKNHYFITSMVLDGTSQVEEVLIIRK